MTGKDQSEDDKGWKTLSGEGDPWERTFREGGEWDDLKVGK